MKRINTHYIQSISLQEGYLVFRFNRNEKLNSDSYEIWIKLEKYLIYSFIGVFKKYISIWWENQVKIFERYKEDIKF